MHQSFMSDHSCHTCRCSGMKARTCRTSRDHALSDKKRKQLAGRTVRSCIPASSMPCHVHRNLSTSTYQGIRFLSKSCSNLLLYTVLLQLQLWTSLTLFHTLCAATGGNVSPKNGFTIQEKIDAITHTYMHYTQDTSSTSITAQGHQNTEASHQSRARTQ